MYLFVTISGFMSLVLSSCEKNTEIDVYPINLFVYVVDSEGNNLLDQKNPNNLVGKLNGTITYKNRKNHILWGRPGMDNRWPWVDINDMTRVYIPSFYGVWYNNYDGRETHLEIGEFDGDSSWSEVFTLEFPDYDLKYDFEMVYKGLGDKPFLKVNGEIVKVKDRTPEFTIVLT